MFPAHGTILTGLKDMAEKIVVKLNREGVAELLRSPEMKAVIESQAQQLSDNLGEGYGYRAWYSSKDRRITAFVGTMTDEAFQKNLEENTVLKAVGGAHDD